MMNWKIGRRLGAGFAAVLALMLVMSAIASWRLAGVEQSTRAMMAEPLTKERAISDWYRAIHTSVRRMTAVVKSTDPALATFFAAENAEASQRSSEIQKQIEALLRTDDEKQRFATLGEVRKRYVAARDQIMAAKAADPVAAEKLFESSFAPAGKAYLEGLQGLLDTQRTQIDTMATTMEESAAQARVQLLGLALLALGAGVFFAWSITRSVTAPLQHAVREAQRVAAGDLAAMDRTARGDETGLMLNALADMQGALASVIRDIRHTTDSIGTASSEIATGNGDLSARTEQTAANLQQTASSMEQLTSTVKQTADSARTANQLANSAQASAVEGGRVVSQVVATMADIHSTSNKVVDIISVIDGIAFQTNILALNAAVEAARAGEQGRGFAVVAGEVRSLAQRSANAAKEIKSLIGASVAKVESGTQLVADAGQSMQAIVGSVQRVSDIIGEITAATAEQSDGIGQVNLAVNNLDQMTQQNAALVEESAAAAQSLREQAAHLNQAMARFQLG